MKTNSRQRLFEVMGKVDSSFRQRLIESDDVDDMRDYLMNAWSKKSEVIEVINGSKYLTQKYGKYLQFGENDWRQLSPEELTTINNNWYVDYQNVKNLNRGVFDDNDDDDY